MQFFSQKNTYWLLLLAAVVAYFSIFFDTWVDIERVWSGSDTYGHSYLIIPISLWLFLRTKRANKQHNTTHSAFEYVPHLVILALLQLAFIIGIATDIALIQHAVAVFTLQTLIAFFIGHHYAKQYRFAIFFLVFLIPFGDELSPLLQNITADLTVYFLHLVSVPVYREGLYLTTPVAIFEVAEACSGLRFLISSIAISVLYGYLTYNSILKQTLFVLFMIVTSIIANGMRAFMLVYIGEKSNMEYGFGADHYIYGWLFFGLVILISFWLGAKFADKNTLKSQRLTLNILYKEASTRSLLCIIAVLACSFIYKTSLPITQTPTQPASLMLTIPNSMNASLADWGIQFMDTLQQARLQDKAGIEYFAAVYANRQTQGKLVSWNNRLYDQRRWILADAKKHSYYAILQLKSLNNQYRTVIYWYQINDKKSVSQLETKLLQALNLLSGNQSGSYIFAVSVAGPANDKNVELLQKAAANFNTATKPSMSQLGGL